MWSPGAIIFVIPSKAYTDVVTVSSILGSATSSAQLKVQAIAYILGDPSTGDWSTAEDHKLLIDTYGANIRNSTVLKMPYTDIDNADMTLFDIIIVGWDTGTRGDWAGDVSSRAAAVQASRAPVLGIGVGGAAYFDVIGLDIGRGDMGSEFSMWVPNKADPVFVDPNGVVFLPNGTVAMYGVIVPVLSVDIVPQPLGVTIHALTQEFTTTSPFVEQEQAVNLITKTNFLWGFHASPRSLSVDGVAVLENVVKHLFDYRNGAVIPGPSPAR